MEPVSESRAKPWRVWAYDIRAAIFGWKSSAELHAEEQTRQETSEVQQRQATTKATYPSFPEDKAAYPNLSASAPPQPPEPMPEPKEVPETKEEPERVVRPAGMVDAAKEQEIKRFNTIKELNAYFRARPEHVSPTQPALSELTGTRRAGD